MEESTSYSGWLAMAARKEFTIRAGLASVADFEAEHGAFTDDERADAARWADQVLAANPAVRRASRKRSA